MDIYHCCSLNEQYQCHLKYANNQGRIQGGVLGAQASPLLGQDNIQELIDLWLSNQLKHPPYNRP